MSERKERKEDRDWYAAEWEIIERLKKELEALERAMRETLKRAGTDGPFAK